MYQHKLDIVEILTSITSSIADKKMDSHTYQNWVKIKETFEKSGNTGNMFYRRACEIVNTKKDPLSKYLGDKDD